MHAWGEFIIFFGGCSNEMDSTNGHKKRLQTLNDIMIFHSKTEKWSDVDYACKTKPPPRCRQGSTVVDVKDEKSADLFIFGGHTGKRSLKDKWRARITQEKSRFKIQWEKLEDMKSETHRCFTFSLGESTFLVGGFNRSMMKLLKVMGPSGDLPTYNLMNLPESERKTFSESNSLVGFGAVYDDIDRCLTVCGGGNVGHFSRTSPKQKALGDVDGKVFSKPRIFYLHHNNDNNKWTWTTHEVKD